ncbi:microtubule associated protein-domain-containing protein [Plectosphaerella cucumerina]|uniref:Microtubule associated protein-domain-containing protein n=1 Tax=Plectosphaerella cucumerina TaxID=40658 RepID=A0A8K0TB18_9PEZI|nr:microtubule associated protein-domain-containing protein [Plectosphaerella cucumerina]
MDSSYLSQQVSTIIGQLHGLFDEIGVPNHDREARESELFEALSKTLHDQVRLVTAEKEEMLGKAQHMVTTIRQMEVSLDDSRSRREQSDDDLQITYPLNRCLQGLKEKHLQISRLHKERFEQVKKLVQALESYSSHLEPTFVRIALPPTGPNQSIPPSFDLSPTYVDKLDDEFTRIYDEYTRRVGTVQSLCENIIQLWAELGTPQAQTDGAIVKYYRDSPEQLGLHEEDVKRLRSKRDKLADEKKNRERRLKDLKIAVEALWVKLGVDASECKSFLNANRGCGVRQINQFEDELARLNELKRQNLHLFVEDARCKLQELWDALYLSEDEMLEFTPAFSDVYSDALLEAHEREISRLEAVKEQRAPALALVDKHRQLTHDRDDLAASSQDASRLMMRGQKGERRDPGKLLREEKMRKRIAKELPKVAAELKKLLDTWEDEYGRPFLVHGERYLDVIDADESRAAPAPGPRSKTPAGPPASASKGSKSAPPSRANSVGKAAGLRAGAKTPTAPPPAGKRMAGAPTNPKGSPSRIPARVPLGNLKHGNNSPERQQPDTRAGSRMGENQPAQTTVRSGVPMRAPPPKMRELVPVPELETPINHYKSAGLGSSIVRHAELEDVYEDALPARPTRSNSTLSHQSHLSHSQYDMHATVRQLPPSYPQAPPPRQISNSSNGSSNVTGSENWETYDDNSEPEPDACDTYYEKVRAARGKRMEQDNGYNNQSKRIRGLPSTIHPGQIYVDHEGNRILSKGSEWTDEDAY